LANSLLKINNKSPARIGIGGPVGSGKTALIERLIPALKKLKIECAVVTNDLVTKEDALRLKRSGLINPEKVSAVEAGACPHTIIREDPSLNIAAVKLLENKFKDLDVIFVESGGDNLASTFSLDLVDYWLFVIDTGGGDDIPRKKGPGIVRSDILVINKIDIAPYVSADVELMLEQALEVRENRPVILTDCRANKGIDLLIDKLIHDVLFA
jgi:urease accessory protein